jgi:hypothetical protein
MSRPKRVLLGCIALLLVAGAAGAYYFLFGFPRSFEGRRVHRVTLWSKEDRFRPEKIAYAYTREDGKEFLHGPFQRFEDGHLVEAATYRDGKLDGVMTYWNLLGDKTQELYYRQGVPYGWANFAHGKLVSLRQEVLQDGRSVAVKTFDHDRYSLQFKCGELINTSIDPASGQISPVPNPTQHACVEP